MDYQIYDWIQAFSAWQEMPEVTLFPEYFAFQNTCGYFGTKPCGVKQEGMELLGPEGRPGMASGPRGTTTPKCIDICIDKG